MDIVTAITGASGALYAQRFIQGLVAAGVVTEEELDAAEYELRRVAEAPEGVFFYSFVAARARA